MLIESTRNETVKRAKALHMKKERDASGLHFIEGIRMLQEALKADIKIEEAFLEEGHAEIAELLEQKGAQVHLVSRTVMESVSNTQTPQWVCACVRTPENELPQRFPQGLIVALDAVQDPGNMGTIIRSADALGAGGVLLGDGCADPFSPKALRSTMGSVYHLPVWKCNLPKIMTRLSGQDFLLLCAHLKGSELFPDLPSKSVLVIGNEGNGVSDEVASLCYLYRLPMGRAESLNASVAAGILIYEMARHMNLK